MNPLALFAGAVALLLARRRPRYTALGVLRITRVTADLDRAARFYAEALGATPVSRTRQLAVLHLGGTEIALFRPTRPGRAMRRGSRSDDLWFQHLAITVDDMDAAYARLAGTEGWRPITKPGPQTLPPENGGVRAFKFRDPDGHPLELIWFPTGEHPSIDHTAIAVASAGRSLRFYRGLGFTVAHRSHNRGPVQCRLDALARADVTVIGLQPATPGTGLELLAYRPPGRSGQVVGATDVAADVTTVLVRPAPGLPRTVRDPDGHRLLLIAAPPPPGQSPASMPTGAAPPRLRARFAGRAR